MQVWLTRPQMDRLYRFGLVPYEVDTVHVNEAGNQITVRVEDGSETVVRATSDPFRRSPGGELDWDEIRRALAPMTET